MVAVIGGGSTALDAARSALRAGASAVHILYRRTQAEAPAQPEEVVAALAEGIAFHELVAPERLVGADGDVGQLAAIQVNRMAQGEPDAQGRRSVRPVADSAFSLPIDYALVAIGEAPDPSFLPPGTSVELAAWGGLLVNPETLATGATGVFAAGDITYGPKTVINAAAHGRLAAKSIHAFLRRMEPRAVREMPDDETETASSLPAGAQVVLDLRPTPRAIMPLRPAAQAREKNLEFAIGLSEEQARAEGARCLRCDLAYLCPSVRTITAREARPLTPAPIPLAAPAQTAGVREQGPA